jgi:hypothetical protein
MMVYLGISLVSHDFFWYQTDFKTLPDRVVVYQEGQVISYQAGQSGYEELANAIQSSLSRGVSGTSGTFLTQQDLDAAYFKYVSVEAFFNTPVKVHTWFDSGSPTQILFPITGTYSAQNLVFLGLAGAYPSSGLRMKSLAPLQDVLMKLGYPVGLRSNSESLISIKQE